MYRARFHGFGAINCRRSLRHDIVSPFLILHFIWLFLCPVERDTLMSLHPAIRSYSRLRLSASQLDVSPLTLPRPPEPPDAPTDTLRMAMLAAALLRFNFNYGDLIRWLKGPYTHAHRTWSQLHQVFNTVKGARPPPSWPKVNFPRAENVLQQGVPLQGHYMCSWASVAARNLHPASSELQKEAHQVDERLRKEEKLSYHILLPRFIFRFIIGIHLCLFRIAFREGDPNARLCVDPSTPINNHDDGNTNRQIPAPGIPGHFLENPPIYYGSALMRYLIWLWNLRISFPREDLLQLADDVSAAFHRILYHPTLAPAFALVWKTYLVIPVGTIFGARNSPSFYMEAGKARAHLAMHMPNAASFPLEDLAASVILPPPPTAAEAAAFAQAAPDSQNRGIANAQSTDPERRLPSFVDDSCSAHCRLYIRTCINMTVWAARQLFGYPHEDPHRPPCINPTKWIDLVAAVVKFLGFLIDTRRMLVIWPLDKRHKLAGLLDILFAEQSAARSRGSSPTLLARILGLLRHGAFVAPLGVLQTLRLQFILNDVVSKARGAPQRIRRWWNERKIIVPPPIIQDLIALHHTLDDDLYNPRWCRLIGLLVPRDPTITVCTDASTNGMGGWSSETAHMWRLSIADLQSCSLPVFNRHHIHNFFEQSVERHPIHINILEFVAIIVGLWFIIRQLAREHDIDPSSTPAGGHRILALADNTSALSWLQYATRTRRPVVRRLARFLTAFLSSPFPAQFVRVQSRHLAGKLNVDADLLSRFELAPSWESAMHKSSNLAPLPTCQLPRRILSLLAYLVEHEPTEAWFDNATTTLWTVELPPFAHGSSRLQGTQTSLL